MKKTTPKIIFVLCLVILLSQAFSFFSVSAQSNVSNPGNSSGVTNPGNSSKASNPMTFSTLQNPLQFNSVGGIVNGVADIFTYLVILLAVLMIIYVGLRFVLAQGNTTELNERKTQLMWLLVGVGIVISARVLIGVVINTLKATGVVTPSVINSAQNGISGQP